MAGPNFNSDIKFNLHLRDFFVDFLACLVPGVIFVLSVTILIVGLFFLLLYPIIFKYQLFFEELELLKHLLTNFSFFIKFFGSIFFFFVSFFSGHLLYRQNPKHPDFASFCRVRNKIDLNEEWVIPKEGCIPKHIQFPYSNLKKYLEQRGFDYLAKFIKWSPDDGDHSQRSKTFINKLKVRINFFYPDKMLNIIKNEAHIRLASSMWYCSKYIINLSYFVLGILSLYFFLIKNCLVHSIFLLFIIFILLWYYYYPYNKLNKYKRKIDDTNNNRDASEIIKKIDRIFLYRDRVPVFLAFIFLFYIYIFYLLEDSLQKDMPFLFKVFFEVDFNDKSLLLFLMFYLSSLSLVLLGALFSKHKIESSFHYQRVREIIYVLESAFVGQLLSEEDLRKHLDRFWNNELTSKL